MSGPTRTTPARCCCCASPCVTASPSTTWCSAGCRRSSATPKASCPCCWWAPRRTSGRAAGTPSAQRKAASWPASSGPTATSSVPPGVARGCARSSSTSSSPPSSTGSEEAVSSASCSPTNTPCPARLCGTCRPCCAPRPGPAAEGRADIPACSLSARDTRVLHPYHVLCLCVIPAIWCSGLHALLAGDLFLSRNASFEFFPSTNSDGMVYNSGRWLWLTVKLLMTVFGEMSVYRSYHSDWLKTLLLQVFEPRVFRSLGTASLA